MLVAILKRPDAAGWYQSAIERVFDRFYRHHIEYDHAKSNCAGLSLDALSGLGWQLPRPGATSYVKAVLGYFYSAATDSSFASGKRTFNCMVEERSRLYPRAAFESVGQNLLALVAAPNRSLTRFEEMLRDDVEAIVFVSIPQIPSSRIRHLPGRVFRRVHGTRAEGSERLKDRAGRPAAVPRSAARSTG
jgi:hypothetical protein